MLQIAIVEDEEDYRKQIRSYIEKFSVEHHKKIQIKEFSDGTQIMEDYANEYDIIFLDIEMPMQSGMETAKMIRSVDQDVIIIFVTNMAQYAIHGYEVEALYFILKPINYDSFSIRFLRAIHRIQKKKNGRIVLSSNNVVTTLETRQIYYIESQNRFLIYHTSKGDYSVKGTMKSAEEELADYNFVQCNHWFLVNLQYVSEINNGFVSIAGHKLEISRRKKKEFLELFTKYMGGNI